MLISRRLSVRVHIDGREFADLIGYGVLADNALECFIGLNWAFCLTYFFIELVCVEQELHLMNFDAITEK